LLEYPLHQGLQKWLIDSDRLYRARSALHETDSDPAGFEWIDCNDSEQSTLTMIPKAKTMGDLILIALSRAATAPTCFQYKKGRFSGRSYLIRQACETAY
jgi:1,4-alpha-glucan branching enzyme